MRRFWPIIGAATLVTLLANIRAPRSALVTTWRWQDIEPGFWDAAASAFDGVSAKLLNGAALATESQFDAQAAASRANHLEIWAWGYHYARTAAEAESEGRAIGQQTKARGIRRYCLDLEGEWSGTGIDRRTGKPYPFTADPAGNAIRLIEAARRENPTLEIWWNGYSYRWSDFDVGIGRGPRKGLFSRDVALAISATGGGYMPQCYFTDRATAASATNGIPGRFSKHPDIFPPDQCCALVASQRIDRSTGVQWGDWFTPDGRGDAQLAAPYARTISAWYGSGSSGRMTGTTGAPPALPDLARRWKELRA
jgi:hypothetical protein